jgi:outer membrane protein TolC
MHLQAALLEVTILGLERTRQLIAFAAKKQYLQTVLAKENIKVAYKAKAQATEILNYANARLNAGVGTKLDVLQAEVSVANAEDAILRTEADFQLANSDLAAVLDLPLLTEFVYQDNLFENGILQDEPLPGRDLLPLVEEALGLRPELHRLREELVANHERENIAISGSLPSIEALLNNDLSGHPNRLGEGENLSALMTIPIFDSGLTRAKVKEVRLLGLRLQNQEQQEIETIITEVRQARLDVEDADARLLKAQAAETKATEALRISALRFQVGAGTSLELVTAQAVLVNADFALAQARYRQVAARAALNFALGVPPPRGRGAAGEGDTVVVPRGPDEPIESMEVKK